MALIRESYLDTGVCFNYWKIEKINISFTASEPSTANILVLGFLDKKSRNESKKHLQEVVYEGVPVVITGNNITKQCYDFLKQEEFFKSAGDDL